MIRIVKNWSVEKLNKERSRITFPEYQREDNLWSDEKKSLLIDSILRDIDIPKLYFNLRTGGSIEVVDGQQRLWAIWGFLGGKYKYKAEGKSKKFSELTPTQKRKIINYNFQVTEFEEAEDDYLRVLFVRLQLGLFVNTGEKLHASKGKMKRLVFEKLARHPFIENIGIPKRRYAKETLCAQICINSFNRDKLGKFARTRYEDLQAFFNEYADPKGKDLERFNEKSRNISKVMDQHDKSFGKKARDLKNRSFILSIYLSAEEIIRNEGDLSVEQQKLFSNFVLQLWKRLREEAKLGMDRKNRTLYAFQTLLSSAPGEVYQIDDRHKKLSEYYKHYEKTGKIKGDR